MIIGFSQPIVTRSIFQVRFCICFGFWLGGWGPTMTIEPSEFPNGHGQNEQFDHDHNTIFIIKWLWSNGQN